MLKVYEAGSILNIGFANLKWSHLHRAYLVSSAILSNTQRCSLKFSDALIVFFQCSAFLCFSISAMLSPAQPCSAALSCAQLRSTTLSRAQPCTAKNKWNSIPELQRATILGTVRDHFTKVGKWHFSKTYIYITCPKFDLSVSFYTIIINIHNP